MAKKVKGQKMAVGFLLDETGSMGVVKQQTIDGFNKYVETLRLGENADAIRFTLTKFNSEKTEVVHDGVKLRKVASLTNETYQPAALTPLYDAIGQIVRSMEESGESNNVLVVIQTDGQENHSREFDRKSIFDLIDEKKEKGWTFVFLGADQDAWLTGQSLGISRGNVMSYDSVKTYATFVSVANSTTSWSANSWSQTDRFFSGA